jgi:hypothetical protein
MGRCFTKSQSERQVVTTKDHDLPLASLLVHYGISPRQAGLTYEAIRINGDGHPRIPGTRAQPVGEEIYGRACRHAGLS